MPAIYSVCTLGGLGLGLGAWALAVCAIVSKRSRTAHRFTAVSFILCAGAILLQLAELNSRALAGDFAGIEDTLPAVILAACVLAGVTAALNLLAAVRARA